MLEQVWTRILELTGEFVIPDWGVLIGLIPIAIVIVVVFILLATFRGLVKAPPARRGFQRVEPRTPAGIHMPGPSFAPVFAAFGVGLLMLGLVFGGIILLLGTIALVLTLLYWLAEGLRNYDHEVGSTVTVVLAASHDGPPPGVHMPGPSWRPFLGAFGVFALLLGLVFGGWLLSAGVITLIATLVGWLADAVKEYRMTVRADSTGHLENIPESRPPSLLFGTLVALIVGAALLQTANFVVGEVNGGAAAAGESGAPAEPGDPSGAPPPASGPTADVNVQARNVLFVEESWSAPADKPFTIAFANEDAGVPHNIELLDRAGAVAFNGDIFNGVETRIYEVPALPAGTYEFLCVVHPTTMTGTATLE
jgi:plastocyanin